MANIGTATMTLQAKTAQFTRDIQSAGRTFQDVGRNMQKTGRTLQRNVTLPLLAVGAGVLTVAAKFQYSMNRVRGLTGATGESLEAMSAQARELGETTQFSASQAADAMSFLAMAGFKADQILGAMPHTLNLAAAAQLDLARAADITSNILTGYNLKVSELEAANDALVAASTNANVTVEMLGESFRTAGPIAASIGLEFNEVAAAIGTLGNAGIQGAQAGTALRVGLGRLLNPTNEVEDALADLNLTSEMLDPRLATLTEIVGRLEDSGADAGDILKIFGQRGAAIAPLIGQGADAIQELQDKLDDSAGAAKNLAEIQMEGLRGAMLELKSAVEGAAIAIAESGMIMWAEDLARSVSEVTRNIAAADPAMLKLGTQVAAVAAIAGPFLLVFGKIVELFGSSFSVIGKVILALTRLHPAIAIISTVLIAGIAIWAKWGEEITALGNAVAAVVRERLAPIGDIIKAITDTVVFHFSRWMSEVGQPIIDFVLLAGEWLIDKLGAIIAGAAGVFGRFMMIMNPGLRDAYDGISSFVEDVKAELDDMRTHAVGVGGDIAEGSMAGMLPGQGMMGMDAPPMEDFETDTGGGGPDRSNSLDQMEELTNLLSDALDINVEWNGLVEDAIDLREQLDTQLAGEVSSLEEALRLTAQRDQIEESITNHLLERAAIEEKSLELASGVPSGDQPGVISQDVLRNIPDLQEILDTDQAAIAMEKLTQTTANSFEMNWQSAISVIGAQMGGLASQAANVATAFLSGGPAAGIPALIGAGMSLLGGDPATTQEEYNRELEEFVNLGRNVSETQQQINEVAAQAGSTIVSAFESITGGELSVDQMPETRAELEAFIETLRQFAEIRGVGAEFEAELENITQALEDHIDRIQAARQAEIESYREELEIRGLVAQGHDEAAAAMRLEIERQAELQQAFELGGIALVGFLTDIWKLEDAAREAAAAEEEVARARKETETQASLAARAATLWGTSLEAAKASAEAAAISERNRAMQAFEAGRIGEETLNQWLEVIDGEYTAAVQSATQAVRDAAQAERERMRSMTQNLELRLLMAQGQDAAADALRNQIEVERFLKQGADAATIALLQQVQAAEAQAEAAQGAGEAFRTATGEMDKMRQATVANAPTAFRLAHREFQASAPGPVDTGMSQSVDQSTNTFHISVAADGRPVSQLVDEIAQEIQKRQRSGAPNTLQIRTD